VRPSERVPEEQHARCNSNESFRQRLELCPVLLDAHALHNMQQLGQVCYSVFRRPSPPEVLVGHLIIFNLNILQGVLGFWGAIRN